MDDIDKDEIDVDDEDDQNSVEDIARFVTITEPFF